MRTGYLGISSETSYLPSMCRSFISIVHSSELVTKNGRSTLDRNTCIGSHVVGVVGSTVRRLPAVDTCVGASNRNRQMNGRFDRIRSIWSWNCCRIDVSSAGLWPVSLANQRQILTANFSTDEYEFRRTNKKLLSRHRCLNDVITIKRMPFSVRKNQWQMNGKPNLPLI